jgi:hypothetical protein
MQRPRRFESQHRGQCRCPCRRSFRGPQNWYCCEVRCLCGQQRSGAQRKGRFGGRRVVGGQVIDLMCCVLLFALLLLYVLSPIDSVS